MYVRVCLYLCVCVCVCVVCVCVLVFVCMCVCIGTTVFRVIAHLSHCQCLASKYTLQ